MSTIKVAMEAMGYTGPHERQHCKDCHYCEQRPNPAIGQRSNDLAHYCRTGGFLVSAFAVCKVFKPRGVDHG